MSTKSQTTFRGLFGAFLNQIEGSCQDGAELTRKELARRLGCCTVTIANWIGGKTDADASVIWLAMTSLPRSASQILIDRLDAARPAAEPAGPILAEMAEAQQADAGTFCAYADAMSDGRMDAAD